MGDTTLRALVRTALRENRDLYIALARVNEARALLGVQRFEAYPQIDVRASTRRSNGADSSISGSSQRSVVFVEAELSWEVDLWGRLRRLNEVRPHASGERAGTPRRDHHRRERRGRAYLELRDLDAQLTIADAQLEIRQRSLDLARARFRGRAHVGAGCAPGRGRARGGGRHQSPECSASEGRRRTSSACCSAARQRMFPAAAAGGAAVPQSDPGGACHRSCWSGGPTSARRRSSFTRQMPIGAAIAARFPTISLTAGRGNQSATTSDPVQDGTGFWNIAGNLLQPLLNSGRNKKQVAAERARTEAAVDSTRNCPDGVQRGGRRLVAVQRLREEAEAAGRASAAHGWRSDWRETATRAAWTPISTCSMPSVPSSTPSAGIAVAAAAACGGGAALQGAGWRVGPGD